MKADAKFIVWDWNGTLLDDAALWMQAMNSILVRTNRRPVDLDYFRTVCVFPVHTTYRNLGFTEDEIENQLSVLHGLAQEHYARAAVAAALRPSVPALLEQWVRQGLSQLILSNHFVTAIEADLERFGVRQHFTRVLAMNHVQEQVVGTIRKGERLRLYLQEQGGKPANGLIVGDTEEEVEIARAHGMVSVAITGGVASEERLRAAQPDYVIHDLSEMQPILAAQGFVS